MQQLNKKGKNKKKKRDDERNNKNEKQRDGKRIYSQEKQENKLQGWLKDVIASEHEKFGRILN